MNEIALIRWTWHFIEREIFSIRRAINRIRVESVERIVSNANTAVPLLRVENVPRCAGRQQSLGLYDAWIGEAYGSRVR